MFGRNFWTYDFLLNASAEHGTRESGSLSNFRDKITVGVFASDSCAEGGLGTSHLRGGAGLGYASCIGGATFNHRQNSTTPLKQIGESQHFFFIVLGSLEVSSSYSKMSNK
ncbi:hypothetical protein PUN28_013769 [Cardiocondyla obscurior]|uniref:Uncharacterized protein n=1 Tax=Cardiocondyla obscurior TaxID=286306 RepID=A0AAW2F817_9HYME